MRVKSKRPFGSRGAYDRETIERNKERAKVWPQVLKSKDPRKFGEFLRQYGILDGTPEFVAAYEKWWAYHGKPSQHTASHSDDVALSPAAAKSKDAPQ
ncbi:MAG: hypothetical protein A3H28_12680 [Acidobacteria bacterium RIFCSPLOWO2_02_FULL_61_28]|nr:MAG: hypothetical protein A3H28_12680 [Acidobacteria bacterium RIFCSPLOWO2_02_FULL_61_28]